MPFKKRTDRVSLYDRLGKSRRSPSRIKWLSAAMAEKNIGSWHLFQTMTIKPDGLNYGRIESWVKGRVKTAKWNEWLAVKNAIRAYNRHDILFCKDRVDLNESLNKGPSRLEWLIKTMEAKGIGSRALFSAMSQELPDTLKERVVNAWLRQKITTASWEHWIAVKQAVKNYDRQEILTNTGRIDLNEIFNGKSRIDWLLEIMAQKNLGIRRLFNAITVKPEGLNHRQAIQHWLHGRTKIVRNDHWTAVETAAKSYEPK